MKKLELIEEIIKVQPEYTARQVDYTVNEGSNQIELWSLNATNGILRSVSIITAIKAVASCFVSFNPVTQRCELVIF